MKKKQLSKGVGLAIDQFTKSEEALVRGGATASKIKITGTISVNYPPVKGEISISNKVADNLM